MNLRHRSRRAGGPQIEIQAPSIRVSRPSSCLSLPSLFLYVYLGLYVYTCYSGAFKRANLKSPALCASTRPFSNLQTTLFMFLLYSFLAILDT